MEIAAFETAFGAAAADLDRVCAFVTAHGLAVASRDAGRRMVVLSGTVAAFEAAFGVELHQFD